ncbi:fumarylacetoacetate hydrolase family protein [Iodobacter sp. HSC-16F04]|uniref:Fumarylacetoacetate hydrolase family protein n=1 Tax=Iodobacter violaceini TaxID=3044271 RepID=A0ABX0KQ23_9NEIS|nr:fumarylacetoacetate hydrolase family protein [Iodobacter violacea]NHQ85952.1 fumarylacetoacetate hydrolase family protein [Iodobacter violacea]
MPSIRIDQTDLRVNNIFCVARNYLAHAAEMGASIGSEPVVFIKPNSAILQSGQAMQLPSWSKDVHHEAELVVAIGRGGKNISKDNALEHVAGYALGLDLTARDVQAEAKRAGMPWTLSKGFDGAAVLTQFVPASVIRNPFELEFTLEINGKSKQQADTRLMAFDVATLISWISSRFTLQAGDLIYTGTPEGVGQLHSGDQLKLTLGDLIEEKFVVA